jgi:hypothetical protein
MSSKNLYQETNPYGSFTAYLEEDERTTYLYLQCENNPEWGIKSLWIRNHIEAPASRNPNDFHEGLAPILVQSEVANIEGMPSIQADEIHFIWTEEGDGVFLFLGDDMEAFLPAWSGLQNLHGYAIGAKEDSITASPLGDPKNGAIYDRMILSRKYWEDRSHTNSWNQIQKHRMDYLESIFGKHNKYWSADGGKYPQLGIASFQSDHFPNLKIFSTIGMSAQNQPSIELYHKSYNKFSRIELILFFQIPEHSDRSEEWIQHLLGEMIKFPWNTGNWFGHGHTLGMNRRDPDQLYLNFSACMLRNLSHPSEYPLPSNHPKLDSLLSENGEPVNFLALIPITDEEKLICHTDGSKKIIDALDQKNLFWIHNPERESLL